MRDVTELAALLDAFVTNANTATEDQLFWIAKIAEDYLQETPGYAKLLLRLYQHREATSIVQAKVLEINGLKAGFQDIREKHLQGSSDWRTWASIVGSASMPKGARNQMLKHREGQSYEQHCGGCDHEEVTVHGKVTLDGIPGQESLSRQELRSRQEVQSRRDR